MQRKSLALPARSLQTVAPRWRQVLKKHWISPDGVRQKIIGRPATNLDWKSPGFFSSEAWPTYIQHLAKMRLISSVRTSSEQELFFVQVFDDIRFSSHPCTPAIPHHLIEGEQVSHLVIR
jgi:hypothetical protein